MHGRRTGEGRTTTYSLAVGGGARIVKREVSMGFGTRRGRRKSYIRRLFQPRASVQCEKEAAEQSKRGKRTILDTCILVTRLRCEDNTGLRVPRVRSQVGAQGALLDAVGVAAGVCVRREVVNRSCDGTVKGEEGTYTQSRDRRTWSAASGSSLRRCRWLPNHHSLDPTGISSCSFRRRRWLREGGPSSRPVKRREESE